MNDTLIRTSTNGSRRLLKSMHIMHRWCWSSSEGCETPRVEAENQVCAAPLVSDLVRSRLGPQPSLWWPAPPFIPPPSGWITLWVAPCKHFVFPTAALRSSTSHTSPASRLNSSPSLPQYFTDFSLFICTKPRDTLNNTRLDCHDTFSL